MQNRGKIQIVLQNSYQFKTFGQKVHKRPLIMMSRTTKSARVLEEKNEHNTSQTFFCGTCDENRFKADVYQHVYQLACLTQKIYQQHINMQRYFLLSQTKFYFLQKTTFYLLLRTTTGNMQKQATSYQIPQKYFQNHFFQLQTPTRRVGQP